jgi:hypothetical protein
MGSLAELMESCDGVVRPPGDWRKDTPSGSTYSEDTSSLVAFDALCTLSKFHHRRGNIDDALGWARGALRVWFGPTTVGQGGNGIQVGG